MKFIMNKIPNMAKMMRKFKVGMAGSPNILRAVYHNYGTAMGNTLSAETGDSPVKNWKGIGMYDFPFSKSKEISINEINKYKISEYGCFSCPVQCGGILNVPELNIKEMHTPEYETCCAFGTLLLNNDLHTLFEINDLCNRAGIDTISLGSTIGFAIECFENGIINQEDTGGLDLNWGNSKEIIKLVKMIIARNGFGDILADGSKIASEKIGKGSEDFSITSLGSEIAMHDPRYTESLAFSYAFDPTPGRHTSASIDFTDVGPIDKFEPRFKLPPKWKKNPDRKAEAQRVCTGFHQILSSSGLCMFSASMGEYPFIDLINSLTGWEMSAEDLITSGIRIQTLRQAFTLREGIDIANNKLPGRVLGIPPDVKGPLKGITVEPEEFYGKYCEKMGWNPNDGYPLEETLKKLDLEFVIKDLY